MAIGRSEGKVEDGESPVDTATQGRTGCASEMSGENSPEIKHALKTFSGNYRVVTGYANPEANKEDDFSF